MADLLVSLKYFARLVEIKDVLGGICLYCVQEGPGGLSEDHALAAAGGHGW